MGVPTENTLGARMKTNKNLNPHITQHPGMELDNIGGGGRGGGGSKCSHH